MATQLATYISTYLSTCLPLSFAGFRELAICQFPWSSFMFQIRTTFLSLSRPCCSTHPYSDTTSLPLSEALSGFYIIRSSLSLYFSTPLSIYNLAFNPPNHLTYLAAPPTPPPQQKKKKKEARYSIPNLLTSFMLSSPPQKSQASILNLHYLNATGVDHLNLRQSQPQQPHSPHIAASFTTHNIKPLSSAT